MSRFARLCKEQYDTLGFVGALVYGRQNIGKSRYCLIVLHKIYEDWDLVLKHTVFPVWEVIKILKGERKRAIVWDDMGIHANKYLYFLDREYAWHLDSLFNIIKTKTAVFIGNAPSPRKFLRGLNEDMEDWFVIKITYFGKDRRMANVYQSSLLPNGLSYTYLKWKETFSMNYVPKDVLDEYFDKRNYYAEYVLNLLEKYIRKKKKVKKIGIQHLIKEYQHRKKR